MDKKLRLLIVEDSEDDALLVLRKLRSEGYDMTHRRVDTAEAMKAALSEAEWDAIICDYVMPRFSAPDALKLVRERGLDMPFIVMSGIMGEDTAVAMMKAGAHDYIRKDTPARLVPALARELRDAEGRKERRRVEEEARKFEAQLRQAQKMETVGLLAGGIAHDFNNILTAMIGYGYLLRMKIPDDPAVAYVDQVLSLCERAANLTRDLLAFSRQQSLNQKSLDLNETIRGVEKLLRRVIGEDIDFQTVLSAEALTVMADAGQMVQVLMNLCTNARDAMPRGGRLIIETSLVMPDVSYCKAHLLEKPGQYVLIAVSDTGCGMDEATQQRIFEPFFTTKELGKGTGLGLSIVYGIIKQHNGSVGVYSEPGKGTTFKIHMPLLLEAAAVDAAIVTEPPAGGTETILVAEDDKEVRTLIKTVLEEAGYTVLEARDGEEAVGLFGNNRDHIHLVLLDVIMPRKNGKEAYEEILKMRPCFKAVFMSGYTADIVTGQGIIEQGMPFVSKPVTPYDLLKKVRETLDS